MNLTIEDLQRERDALKAHRDGLYKVFGWLARDERLHLATVDERIQADVDAVVCERDALKKRVPIFICSVCKTEADPACAPDPDKPKDIWCEPCMEVKRLKTEVEEVLDWCGQLANCAGWEDTPEDQADVDALGKAIGEAFGERETAQARVEELEGDVEKWRSRNDEPDFTDDDREWLASRPGKEALLAEYQEGARRHVDTLEEFGAAFIKFKAERDAAQADLKEALCQSALDKRQCDDATQEAGRLAVELEEAVETLVCITKELGEPQPGYPAPVTLAIELAQAFLSKHPTPSPEGGE